MVLVLFIAGWVVLVAFVVGLCASARAADANAVVNALAYEQSGHAEGQAWAAEPPFEISAHANVLAGPSLQSEPARMRSGDIAA